MDPITATMAASGGASLLTPLAILGASAINATVAYKNTTRNIKAQKERDERLAELQERHRLEDKRFQIARDRGQEDFQLYRDESSRRFTLEVEAQRMAFQEHMELRRLQFQVRMEQRREEFQTAMQSRQFEHNREIAQFQAQAMRETQILVARENAQNMLANQMVLEALKTFPLNISPMVLLNSRPHTLSSLLRFTVGEQVEVEDGNKKKLLEAKPVDVLQDVLSYAEHPEALNIFIAPVFVDSKLAYQKTLSTKIWEATYQKIESFFTKNYSRDSRTPVVFYPTAWNDKYTSGVHASETLHYFLKDLPCIVLEPKFDGNKFRMAVSSWGLGYGSTEHHRTECEFDVNIDLAIANAVYERSLNALSVINVITETDIMDADKRKYFVMEQTLEKNKKLYEALNLGEFSVMEAEQRQRLINQIAALGIGNIFSVDNAQDLEPIANYFESQIGVTLAMLADIHHLIATNALPRLPKLMSEGHFSEMLANKAVCEKLCQNYTLALAQIREEECSLAVDAEESGRIYKTRINESENIRKELGVAPPIPLKTWQEQIRKYTKERVGYENENFEMVWSKFIYNTSKTDLTFLQSIMPQITDEDKRDELESKIENLL